MPSSLFFNWLNQYCITVLLSGAAWQWEDFGSYASSQDSPPCIVPVFISKYRGFHGGWLSSEMGKGKVEGWCGGVPHTSQNHSARRRSRCLLQITGGMCLLQGLSLHLPEEMVHVQGTMSSNVAAERHQDKQCAGPWVGHLWGGRWWQGTNMCQW